MEISWALEHSLVIKSSQSRSWFPLPIVRQSIHDGEAPIAKAFFPAAWWKNFFLIFPQKPLLPPGALRVAGICLPHSSGLYHMGQIPGPCLAFFSPDWLQAYAMSDVYCGLQCSGQTGMDFWLHLTWLYPASWCSAVLFLWKLANSTWLSVDVS